METYWLDFWNMVDYVDDKAKQRLCVRNLWKKIEYLRQ